MMQTMPVIDIDHYQPNHEILKQYISLHDVSYRTDGVEADGVQWRWIAVSRGNVPFRSNPCYTITLGFWSPRLKTWHHYSFVYSEEEVAECRWWEF